MIRSVILNIYICRYCLFFLFYFIFKLYTIVLVLPNIKMNPPQVYMCSPSWTLLPPPSPFHPSEWLRSKSLQAINAGEVVEKREPSYTVGGNANWCSHYGEHYVLCVLVIQSCPTLCDSMDSNLPSSSVHGILQARILEWHYQRNENQNHNEVPSHTGQNGCHQKVYKQ